MSFPNLVLSGDPLKFSITAIQVSYPNDTSGILKPARIIRDRYDVKRETQKLGPSSATPSRYNDIRYDRVRRLHSFVGHLDVYTESVSETSESSAATILNIGLIQNAVILDATSGIVHSISVSGDDDLGPGKPSSTGTYTPSTVSCPVWTYGVKTVPPVPPATSNTYTYKNTFLWFIRNISVTDRHDNTSRVSFTFEASEPWKSIEDIIEGLAPEE